jgi:hypothetical protein
MTAAIQKNCQITLIQGVFGSFLGAWQAKGFTP